MPIPRFTVDDLEAFSGREAESYPQPFSGTALSQAVLLFKLATGLADFPDDPQRREVARYAVLALADEFVLQQPYQQVIASPLNSESIGSYHYMKTRSRSQSAKGADAAQGNIFARAVQSSIMGADTGVMWFDIAVQTLGIKNQGQFLNGGIEVFEHDAIIVKGLQLNKRLLSPQDLRNFESWYGQDPSQSYGAVPVIVAGEPSITPAAGVVIEADAEWIEDPPGSGLFVPPWEREGQE